MAEEPEAEEPRLGRKSPVAEAAEEQPPKAVTGGAPMTMAPEEAEALLRDAEKDLDAAKTAEEIRRSGASTI